MWTRKQVRCACNAHSYQMYRCSAIPEGIWLSCFHDSPHTCLSCCPAWTLLHKFVVSRKLGIFCLCDLMRTGGNGSATHIAQSVWTKRALITRVFIMTWGTGFGWWASCSAREDDGSALQPRRQPAAHDDGRARRRRRAPRRRRLCQGQRHGAATRRRTQGHSLTSSCPQLLLFSFLTFI